VQRVSTFEPGIKAMRKIYFTFAAALFALAIHAQETNALKTEIENFEARTNTVIVKGIGQVGSLATGAGSISVRAKESADISGGKKYGVAIELTSQTPARQVAILDEEELEPLVNGLDYLSKITSDASALPSFSAEFKTRSGLRFIAHSSRRQSSIQFFIQFDDCPRVSLNTDEIVQLKNLAGQALASINDLKRPK
jgi:hypothetical protein